MRTTTVTVIITFGLLMLPTYQSSFTKLSEFSINSYFKSPQSLSTEERFNFFKSESSPSGNLTVTAGWKEHTPHVPTTPKLIIQKTAISDSERGKVLSEETDQKIIELSSLSIAHIEDFIFYNDNQILIYYKQSSGTPEYQISLFEINHDTLEITKKESVMPSQDANGQLNTLTSFSWKKDTGALFSSETLTGFYFPSDDISSVVKFKFPTDTYAISFNTHNPQSKLAVIALEEKIGVFDYSTATADTEVAVTEYAIDAGFYVCDWAFNKIDQNRFLTLMVSYDDDEANAVNSKLKYYDLKASGLDILGQADLSSESFIDMTSSRISNIAESNYFLFGLTKFFKAEYEIKVYLTDVTSATTATAASPVTLTYHQVTDEILGVIPIGSVENAKIMSFRPVGYESSNFLLTITHGTIEAIDGQDIGKNGYSFAFSISLCHPTCLTCKEIGNESSCLKCSSETELKKTNESDETGKCVGYDTKDLPKATCGANAIIGCIKCSGDQCSSCTNGFGLDKYNQDFTAGEVCIKCPAKNCDSCEMKSGDTKRKCEKCFKSFSLKEVDGEQMCEGLFSKFNVGFWLIGFILILICLSK